MHPRLALIRACVVLMICSATCAGQRSGAELASVSTKVQELTQRTQFAEAIAIGEAALRDTEQNVAIDDPRRIGLVVLVASAESIGGKAAAAADLLQRTLRDLEMRDPTTLAVADIRLQLALVYSALGRPIDAEISAAKGVEICRSRLSMDDPRLASALLTLALQKPALAKLDDELPLLKQALRIVSNPQSQEAARTLKLTLLELAIFYDRAGDPDKAVPYRNRAATISGSEADDYAELSGSGMRALRSGDFVEASRIFERLVATAVRIYGENGLGTVLAKQELATAYLAERDREKAKPVIMNLLESVHGDYLSSLPLMSQEELLDFAQTTELRFSMFFSYVHDFHGVDPDLVGRMYDSALWSKGMVLEGAAAVRVRLRNSRDPELLRLSEELTRQQNSYRAAATSATHDDLYRIRSQTQELEHQIVASLDLPISPPITWRDVKRQLKSGDAAVEVLRFVYFNGRERGATTYYVALVLKPELSMPIYVYLGDNTDLEDRQVSAYTRYVSKKATDQDLNWRPTFWTILQEVLGRAKRVFIAPDGVLNNISFAVIPNRDGSPLIESYDVRVVSSTRDLVPGTLRPDRTATAVLVGDPDFDFSQESHSHDLGGTFACSSLPDIATGTPSTISPCPPGHFCPLRETATEIQTVGKLLCQHDWRATAFTGGHASKESVTHATETHPRVLHIATHGFFRASRGESGPANVAMRIDTAMLDAGLVFAGANTNMRNGAGPDELRSSVLTAYEISSLDLSRTELTVLSACKTGLADTLSGGEVFGLRRAFQIAGVDGVLMSMWSVPDYETSELMAKFYEAWLGSNDKYSALRDAQLKMRAVVLKRYGHDRPYYWGAFVLVSK
jgi:CHAT domain-containing protein/tetratricopeptide (TPR) repeat protein